MQSLATSFPPWSLVTPKNRSTKLWHKALFWLWTWKAYCDDFGFPKRLVTTGPIYNIPNHLKLSPAAGRASSWIEVVGFATCHPSGDIKTSLIHQPFFRTPPFFNNPQDQPQHIFRGLRFSYAKRHHFNQFVGRLGRRHMLMDQLWLALQQLLAHLHRACQKRRRDWLDHKWFVFLKPDVFGWCWIMLIVNGYRSKTSDVCPEPPVCKMTTWAHPVVNKTIGCSTP